MKLQYNIRQKDSLEGFSRSFQDDAGLINLDSFVSDLIADGYDLHNVFVEGMGVESFIIEVCILVPNELTESGLRSGIRLCRAVEVGTFDVHFQVNDGGEIEHEVEGLKWYNEHSGYDGCAAQITISEKVFRGRDAAAAIHSLMKDPDISVEDFLTRPIKLLENAEILWLDVGVDKDDVYFKCIEGGKVMRFYKTSNNSKSAKALDPEPPPVAGKVAAVKPLLNFTDSYFSDPWLRDLFVARDKYGTELYGQSLMTGDGRDSFNDALQEAIDLPVYISKAKLERSFTAEQKQQLLEILDFTRKLLLFDEQTYDDYVESYGGDS